MRVGGMSIALLSLVPIFLIVGVILLFKRKRLKYSSLISFDEDIKRKGCHMRQIIALGGGGFSMEPENPLLDQYILNQSGEQIQKSVSFLPPVEMQITTYLDSINSSKNKIVPLHIYHYLSHLQET